MKSQAKESLIIHGIAEMRSFAAGARARGVQIGLVPTMGALHEGHLSLIRLAVSENDLVIVSVFVNPIQFDDPGDLASYPKTLESDAAASFNIGADVVFAPNANEMYPEGFSTFIDMTGISEQLCGASRASHFRGVLTVVGKLFGICMPDIAYFGEKDAQQLAVVRKMTAELCMNVKIRGCPTIREDDGLAMSSRNTRLSDEERTAARCLYRALEEACSLFGNGETSIDVLQSVLHEIIEGEPLARIDYIEIVDPISFDPAPCARKGDIIMLAVYIGDTRLIDNMRI